MSNITTSIFSNTNYALHLHTEALARLQEQVSTGAKVNRVSDAPSAAYNILTLNSQGRSLQNYLDSISELIGNLEFCSTVTHDIGSYLLETKLRITQIASGTYDQQSRERAADAINDIVEQIVCLANSKYMNQYIFGGANTASVPYVVERTDGEITRVTYQGSTDSRDIEITPGLKMSASYVGDDIFHSDDRGDPVFSGTTGAKPGTGTSNVQGDVWLTVTQDGTNFRLSIDDGASYITVPSGGDSNQPVTDSRTGRVLYVDSTAITATGVDLVRVPGTYDVFNTLIGIRDILKNKRELSDAQFRQIQGYCLSSLEEASNLLVQDSVTIGSRIGFLDDLKENIEGLKYNTEDQAASLQEADIAQLAIDISRRQVLYQASLSIAAKIMSMSLLDFL